jgi:hypothetical protein
LKWPRFLIGFEVDNDDFVFSIFADDDDDIPFSLCSSASPSPLVAMLLVPFAFLCSIGSGSFIVKEVAVRFS